MADRFMRDLQLEMIVYKLSRWSQNMVNTVQLKQLIICTDECTVLYSLAQVYFSNQMMYLQYSQIKNVRLRAIQMSRQECQTHLFQHNSINI